MRTLGARVGRRGKSAWPSRTTGSTYFSKAIEYHGQHLAIAKEMGDRAGEGAAYANLGNLFESQGDFSKAIEYHGQHLAIVKEVGNRAGEKAAYGNLGTCHMHLNEYVKAVAYFEAQDVMATSLKLAHVQSGAALNMGVVPHPWRPRSSPGPCYWG